MTWMIKMITDKRCSPTYNRKGQDYGYVKWVYKAYSVMEPSTIIHIVCNINVRRDKVLNIINLNKSV